MPTYSYRCRTCGELTDYIRRMADREGDLPCDRHGCGGMGQFVVVAPAMHVWNADRAFFNISHEDEGKKFGTKRDYESFLAQTKQAESSTAAPSKFNRSAKVVMSYK